MLAIITLISGIKIPFLYFLLKNRINNNIITPNNDPRVPVNDHATKAKNTPRVGNRRDLDESLYGLIVRYEKTMSNKLIFP